MDRIVIYNADKSDFITMPRIKKITVGAKEESRRTMMVSGRIVKDILGYRAVIKAEWDYLPVGLAANLTLLLRTNSFVWLEYPSPTGFAEGWFEVGFPSMKVFTYRNGEAVWHDVSLEFTAKEVTADGI
ncbi:MAG: hypothetical protein PHE51_01045 [Eubacteriales bacterium]|nr:hypothetical protein [Eubacteriales bacterium]